MQHLKGTVLFNREIADGCHHLGFVLPDIAAHAHPGQFLTLRVTDSIAPLLRRPFAFASFDDLSKEASIIYEKRGPATSLLTAFIPGDTLDMLTPLGNTFPLPSEGHKPVLVAGGIGIGPILFFYNELQKVGFDPLLIIGARNTKRIPDIKETKQSLICTDDGSQGIKGSVLVGIEKSNLNLASCEFYACGPRPMMHALKTEVGKHAPVWVSLEQTMGCAVGACMGCVVKTNGPKQYARVCADGPVFDAAGIVW